MIGASVSLLGSDDYDICILWGEERGLQNKEFVGRQTAHQSLHQETSLVMEGIWLYRERSILHT